MVYIRGDKVKLSVTSEEGKDAIIAFLDADEFFGEGCLAGQPLRMATATAMEASAVTRIAKPLMARLLHDEQDVAQLFVTHLLYRNIRYEADLVDQLFNSSERRLARILLLLAHFGKESRMERIVPRITQEALAQMIGTLPERVPVCGRQWSGDGDPRLIDRDAIAEALGLTHDQQVLCSQTVGYPKR